MQNFKNNLKNNKRKNFQNKMKLFKYYRKHKQAQKIN